MSTQALALILLTPAVAWDVIRYALRRRGDLAPARRNAILQHFTAEEIERGREHTRQHNRLLPWARANFYVFFSVLLFGQYGAVVERTLLSVSGALALPLFMLLLLSSWMVLRLPLDAYSEFVIQRQAGLSSTTPRQWLVDHLKGLFLGWVLGTLVAYPVLFLIDHLPRTWPLPATAVVVVISAFSIWISPWVIAPLFNRFSPLTDPRLDQQVRDMIRRADLSVSRVLVMDASRRSRYLNAYFTGLGNSRRVVLFDTLLEACSVPEVLTVVAHELGHWKRRHIVKLFVLQNLGAVVGFFLLKMLLDSPDLRAAMGLPAPSSLVLLVLLPFVSSLAATLSAPLAAAVSRRFERQADRIALQLTQDPDSFISVQKKLARRARADLLVPKMLHWWYGSHPLSEERIRAAEKLKKSAG